MEEKTTVQKFREIMIDMNRGYPEYIYYPRHFEDKFGESYQNVMGMLVKDGIIKQGSDTKGDIGFRLTSRGIDIANSIITSVFTKKTHGFTRKIFWLTILMVILVAIQLILFGFQISK